MIRPNIHNETTSLKLLIVGIADSFGGVPALSKCIDPKSRVHILAGTYPIEEDIVREMDAFIAVFEKYEVKVIRPKNIKGLNQIFTRDIAFVVEDKLVISNIIEERKNEIEAVANVLYQIHEKDIVKMPIDVWAEGGDIMPWNEYLFVGYSEKEDFEKYTVARTNKEGVAFLATTFPNKKVKGFELNKSDDNPRENALHLDCCFQPIGKHMAILYKGGFKHKEDVDFLVNYFGADNIIEISKEEMYNMNSNVFSISESVIISENGFTRLNNILRERGFIVEEVSYAEIAKMEGLLRCSTMPIIRE